MTDTVVFFLASDAGSTEDEGNRITSLKNNFSVTVWKPAMGSAEAAVIGASFVAALERKSIPAEAKALLCKLYD